MDMKRMLLPLSLAAALAGLADGPFAPGERIVAAVSACFQPSVRDRLAFLENTLLPAIRSRG